MTNREIAEDLFAAVTGPYGSDANAIESALNAAELRGQIKALEWACAGMTGDGDWARFSAELERLRAELAKGRGR